MELQERYIAAGLKHIPPTEKDGVEKAMRRIIAERLQERGNASEETEREVLRGLGSPRILAEKQLREPPHLIGPELYGTYMLIVKIVMTVAVIGTLIGNTVDFIVNGETILRYIAQSFAAAIGVAIGAFGWVTLVFAIMERTAKQKILTEIQEDWSLADLPEKEVPQKPFNKVGVIIGIIFTVLFIILVNQYSQLLGFYYTLDGSIQEMIPMLNQEVDLSGRDRQSDFECTFVCIVVVHPSRYSHPESGARHENRRSHGWATCPQYCIQLDQSRLPVHLPAGLIRRFP